jgi:hypothetical protein
MDLFKNGGAIYGYMVEPGIYRETRNEWGNTVMSDVFRTWNAIGARG